MRDWRKPISEGACYEQKTSGEINGLQPPDFVETANGALKIIFRHFPGYPLPVTRPTASRAISLAMGKRGAG
jgi:hypothetical protein